MNNPHILIAGGDLRQAYLSEILRRMYTVSTIGLDKIPNPPGPPPETEPNALSAPDYLMLPIPAMSDDLYLNTPFPPNEFQSTMCLTVPLHTLSFSAEKLAARWLRN